MTTEQQNIMIDELLRDSVLTVIQLKEGSAISSVSNLYKQCKQQVLTLREQLHVAQYSQDVIDDISYALCALLDETVLLCSRDNTHPQNYDEWLGAPLQVVFFNTNNAGHDLFEKIRSRLRADKKEYLILNCFDRILGLGFQGCYLGQPQMEREHLIIALREALHNHEPELEHAIIVQNKSFRYLGRKTLLMLFTLLSIGFVIGLYFFLDDRLNDLIKPLI
ncbi:DotU family type IV/VI secretion system protein [Frischella perrara]|uniref:Type IV / VI secretion system protein, DotU family n=1 Tax=Frischella perrara TaxID=1267021 RepID=A0A0A7S2I6_FRIPE|nr:DotU/TssL family secretion system protein [Frischella perrara]AJA45760.1 type IV / VI secretion system protein, DotU family [Frischella perrara]PWV60288.1 type VI secretion system protein ImpK [Frischella perrara]